MTKSALIDSISKAFKDVRLEEGTGLYEAGCMDDYLSPADPVYILWKEKDERENWENLLPLFLKNGDPEKVSPGNWYFMDAKGKRFHLPCFLLLDIDNKLKGENPIIVTLNIEPAELSDFNILNTKQKRVILDFLEYKIEEFANDNNDFDFDNYNKAKAQFVRYMNNKN
jgi:hypothetical protein